MKKTWQTLVIVCLIIVTLSLTVTACPAPPEVNGNQVPVITLKRVAPNNLTLPGEVAANIATPSEGAILVNGGLRLSVPPGAVSDLTPVTIKKFTQTPASMVSAKSDAKETVLVSDLYDLGPDNSQFNKPVQVTIPYDESSLPQGCSEEQIGPICFDGKNWVPVERVVDTKANLVSFQTMSFPGQAVILGVALGAWTWPAYIAVGAVIAVSWYYATPKITSQVKQDPVYWNNAAKYVTPNDPTVIKYGNYMKINYGTTNGVSNGGTVTIQDMANDPQKLKDFVNNASKGATYIQFTDGRNYMPFNYKETPFGEDWKMPSEFFNQNLTGDCKNVANAMASIFRHYGYNIKCVDGYQGQTRHGWAELEIEGRSYYVGTSGEIIPLDQAVRQLALSHSLQPNGASSMWDENGQVPYKQYWWLDSLAITLDDTKGYPGGQVMIDVLGAPGLALDIELSVETPEGKVTKFSGQADVNTGVYSLPLSIKAGALPGLYTVYAKNNQRNISGIEVFVIVEPRLTLSLIKSEYAPGEAMILNVSLGAKIKTAIEIDGSIKKWTTDEEGMVFPDLRVPADAAGGMHEIRVRAPELGLTSRITYTVVGGAGITVSISPKELKPGDKFTLSIKVYPPAETEIKVRDMNGTWKTDKTGAAVLEFTVNKDAAPGQYEMIIDAIGRGMSDSDVYTVVTSSVVKPGIRVNAVYSTMKIRAKVTGQDGEEFETELTNGRYIIAGTLDNNNRLDASQRVFFGAGLATLRYTFQLSPDLGTIVNGSVSLVADNGKKFIFSVNGLPRVPEAEADLKGSGMEGMVYGVQGLDLNGHYSSVSFNDPDTGTVSRIYPDESSSLGVILLAATDEQMAQFKTRWAGN